MSIEYKVGQKVYLAFGGRHHTQNREVTVKSVGRKWVVFDYRDYRVAKDSVRLDGGDYSSPGRVYENQAAYDIAQATCLAYSELLRLISGTYGTPRDGVTLVAIAEAKKLLGFTDAPQTPAT